MIFFVESIPVRQKEMLVAQCHGRGFPVNGDAGFLSEVIEHPDVMIAGKIVDPDSAVRQFSYFAKDPGKAPGYHRPVFKPEVEQVPHQEDIGGRFLYFIQESDQLFFPYEAARVVGCAKVSIRQEVYEAWFIQGQRSTLSSSASRAAPRRLPAMILPSLSNRKFAGMDSTPYWRATGELQNFRSLT